jgi:hypothetical protein
MNGLTFRKATRADRNAMLMLLRSVKTEGNMIPLQNGIDGDFIDIQWFSDSGCVSARRDNLFLSMYYCGANIYIVSYCI